MNGELEGSVAVLYSGSFSNHALLTKHRNGVRNGKFCMANECGNVVIEGTYVNGEIDGETTIFSVSTGKVRMRGASRCEMWRGMVR